MNNAEAARVTSIREYWNSHTLGLQYVTDKRIQPGTPEFFEHIRPWMTPFKFPWILDRIDREAALLSHRHLLEIGCGLGYDSLEFLKRGVKVTATDLTPAAVEMTRKHFDIEGVQAEDIRIANAMELDFEDDTFDAVWSDGVLHTSGNTEKAVQEARRVVKPGGRIIISHFYRKPSWMLLIHKLGRENLEFKEEDPPVNEFLTEREMLAMFHGCEVVETTREHYRALPIARCGLKANLYNLAFKPVYNLVPKIAAKRLAYKFSVTAVKQ